MIFTKKMLLLFLPRLYREKNSKKISYCQNSYLNWNTYALILSPSVKISYKIITIGFL